MHFKEDRTPLYDVLMPEDPFSTSDRQLLSIFFLLIFYRLTKELDKQVAVTLNNTAKISSGLFPMQVFPLCESNKFVINFKHEMQPNTPGKS